MVFPSGPLHRGDEATKRWFAEVEEVQDALGRVPLDGADVLEVAPGTGIWTELLAERARKVTAVDVSAEMIEQNRRRLGHKADSVSYVVADFFKWKSELVFDAVVFCFWISHVPRARLDEFLNTLASMLRPGGVLFFVDSRKDPTSTAKDHELPLPDEEVMMRRLDDGREFRIVKNFWDGGDLKERFAAQGVDVEIGETANYFLYGIGVRS